MKNDKGIGIGFMQLINKALNSITPYTPPSTIEEFEDRVIADSKAGIYKRQEVIIDSRIAAKVNEQMKKDKGTRFSIYYGNCEGQSVKDAKTGLIGLINFKDNSYTVKITEPTILRAERLRGLEKRMADWYYFTQVKE